MVKFLFLQISDMFIILLFLLLKNVTVKIFLSRGFPFKLLKFLESMLSNIFNWIGRLSHFELKIQYRYPSWIFIY